MPIVTKIEPTAIKADFPFTQTSRVRAAAYARVSTDSDEQFTSFSAQVSYYTELIEANPNYTFVKVYADEGISGTSLTKRKGFNEMLAAARNHEFDILYTKSLSRFARNTLDSISAIRELKDLGIDIYFEEQRLHTINSTGELIITILSALAQEESRNISENVKWGIRKSFADGKVMIPYSSFLGYRKGKDGRPEIDEDEAKVVKLIYHLFISGKSSTYIANYLNENNIPTARGHSYRWQAGGVNRILTNEKYKGEAILQKTYVEDFLTHKCVKNNGAVIPIYHVKESHPFIIPIEEWEMVQVEYRRREALKGKYSSSSFIASKVICADCGSSYGRKLWHSNDKYRKFVYRCNYKFKGKKHCKTPTLSEPDIKNAFITSCAYLYKDMDVRDFEIGIAELTDNELDRKIAELGVELNAVSEAAYKYIEDKKRGIVSGTDKYDGLVDRYKKLKDELDKLNSERNRKISAISRIRIFAKLVENNEIREGEFQEKLWTLLLEKAIVHDDRSIEFIYYNGYRNCIRVD